MKLFPITMLLATLAIGLAGTSFAQPYGSCVGNNSKACRDARAAFAEHHGGVYPEQFYNHWYGGNQGRWYQQNNDWRWEGINGDRYGRGDKGWEWHHYDRDHDHDHDHDRH